MADLTIREARGLFTKYLAETYKERTRPLSFLRSFFAPKEGGTRYVSIEVQRGTEKVAADIVRGTEGNINTFSRSTEKIFEPRLYDEKFNATDLDVYDQLHIAQNGTVSSTALMSWIETVSESLGSCQDKIERAYELQASQVFEDGIVTSSVDVNIDYKRKTTSKVDKGAGNYWATGTVDPRLDIQNGCDWLRANGKVQGEVFNMILGKTAMQHLLSNDEFKSQGDIEAYQALQMIAEPQRNSVGGTLHGYINCGPYKVNLWTYNDGYELSGTFTNYINNKKVIIIPETPKFVMAYAAVPVIPKDMDAVINQAGSFHVYEYLDRARKGHYYGVTSAGLAIPVGVDQMYTLQVVA